MNTTPTVYTLADGQGFAIEVASRGATWLSCRVPVGQGGGSRQVLLGHRSAAEHGVQPGYLGATVGRWANRIGGARLLLDGRRHALAANDGANLLHGGTVGFDKRNWQLVGHGPRTLTLALVSEDGDQGFPGRLEAQVRYSVEGPGHIGLTFSARSDRSTPLNLSNHAYFNLDGTEPQALPVDDHKVAIAAAQVVPVDDELIPLGPLLPVAGTRFDLRQPQALGSRAFDHCFVFDAAEPGDAVPQVRVTSADGRLQLAIATDYPGVQFYTGELLAQGTDRTGQPLLARSGLAIEPQYFPDSTAHVADPAWRQLSPDGAEPGWLLRPGRLFRQRIDYRFTATA